MDQKTRREVATALRTAAAKLAANTKVSALGLSPESKEDLRRAVVSVVNDLMKKQEFLQQVNEQVSFPDDFNEDLNLAAVHELEISPDGKLDIVLGVGQQSVLLSGGAESPSAQKLKSVVSEIASLTDQNHHTEAIKTLAIALDDPFLIRDVNKLAWSQESKGHLTNKLMSVQSDLRNKALRMVRDMYGDDVYQELYKAF